MLREYLNKVSISVHSLRSGKPALKWLILFGVLWAQFAHASHLSTHDTDEFGESCQICAGFEHFENALSDDASAGTIPATTSDRLARFANLDVPECLRAYSARASP